MCRISWPAKQLSVLRDNYFKTKIIKLLIMEFIPMYRNMSRVEELIEFLLCHSTFSAILETSLAQNFYFQCYRHKLAVAWLMSIYTWLAFKCILFFFHLVKYTEHRKLFHTKVVNVWRFKFHTTVCNFVYNNPFSIKHDVRFEIDAKQDLLCCDTI
jgi:hypothetical protein